jgi:hypothetical protein
VSEAPAESVRKINRIGMLLIINLPFVYRKYFWYKEVPVIANNDYNFTENSEILHQGICHGIAKPGE